MCNRTRGYILFVVSVSLDNIDFFSSVTLFIAYQKKTIFVFL